MLLSCSTTALTLQSTPAAIKHASITPHFPAEMPVGMNRRSLLQLLVVGSCLSPQLAFAEQDEVEMKAFIDPMGLFVIKVPKRFFSLRRSAKGDLPNVKTGQGRRGSSIFTSGDMAKAEVVAIERYAPFLNFSSDLCVSALTLVSHFWGPTVVSPQKYCWKKMVLTHPVT